MDQLATKILVPVKPLADLKLNEWDACSLEAAQQLVEASGEGEVVVVSVAGEPAAEVLRDCLAKGADRALRVWDEQLEGADPLAVATVLAGAAAVEQPELIMCGVQSSDSASAATGVALAGLLDLPRVAVVSAIERDGESLTVQRELDGGAVEVLRLSLPALLTIQTGINQPRRPNLRAIKQAREKGIEVLTLSELDLDPTEVLMASGARTLRMLAPEQGKRASMLEGSPQEMAVRIAEIVARELRA